MQYTDQQNNQRVHDFMRTHPCVTVATQGVSTIDLATVFVFVDEVFNLYFLSRPAQRKCVNAEARPIVSAMFVDTDKVEQVEYQGASQIVLEPTTVAKVLPELEKIMSMHKCKYWIPPVSQINDSGYVLVKVIPERIVYRVYAATAGERDAAEIMVRLVA